MNLIFGYESVSSGVSASDKPVRNGAFGKGNHRNRSNSSGKVADFSSLPNSASAWSMMSMYILLIAVVGLRARGLFGRKSALEA